MVVEENKGGGVWLLKRTKEVVEENVRVAKSRTTMDVA